LFDILITGLDGLEPVVDLSELAAGNGCNNEFFNSGYWAAAPRKSIRSAFRCEEEGSHGVLCWIVCLDEETHLCVIDRDGKVILEVRTPTLEFMLSARGVKAKMSVIFVAVLLAMSQSIANKYASKANGTPIWSKAANGASRQHFVGGTGKPGGHDVGLRANSVPDLSQR
jgi:hypothetical protein